MDVVQTGGTPNDDSKDTPRGSVKVMMSGQIIIFHQPRFSGFSEIAGDFPYNSPPFAIFGRVFGRYNFTPTG